VIDRTCGIHHVTAITSDLGRTIDFYERVLGLRLVKRTVHFDNPGMHHFYFGDAEARPGTLVSFLAEPGGAHGTPGNGEIAAVAFSVPAGALTAWSERLTNEGIAVVRVTRFGAPTLAFTDPDGVAVELIETASEPAAAAVSDNDAITGIHSVTLRVKSAQAMVALLTETLGLREDGEEAGRKRFRAAGPGPGAWVDVIEAPAMSRAQVGVGSWHHLAWRTPNDGSLATWMRRVRSANLHVTAVRDRLYMRSIYFRGRSGILQEIATESPGFTADEPVEHLGEALRLPAWLELMRDRIERMLPPIEREARSVRR